KPRSLKTRMGELNLSVPQARDGSFSTQLFARYQRSEKALCLALMETVIQGVTTRRVENITQVLCDTDFSAGTVSNLCKTMDEELEKFRNRDLSGVSYPYLVVDARYEKVRQNGVVVTQAVLIVAGVNEQGYREILLVDSLDLESGPTWTLVFRRLKERGLNGVVCVVSDDHKGIKAATEKEFTGALWQRCRVHFIRNLMGLVSRKERANIVKALHYIWETEDLKTARERIHKVVALYQNKHSKVADIIEEGAEETLTILALPEEHRKRLATNNLLERLSQSVKQRTRLVRIFPNRDSLLRLITAVLQEIHEDWITGHRYLDMSKNKEVDAYGESLDSLLQEAQLEEVLVPEFVNA
ncbi:MAG: IS256 family transposase, partial [Candidatus Omnitrophica bacterium]|nr:IS256 family transposase [Candidatus Omnitrophota bacterium]